MAFIWMNLPTLAIIHAAIIFEKIGPIIAATIHQIAQLSPTDQNLSKSIEMFSIQIMQQPIAPISIYGLHHYGTKTIGILAFFYFSFFLQFFNVRELIFLSLTKQKSPTIG